MKQIIKPAAGFLFIFITSLLVAEPQPRAPKIVMQETPVNRDAKAPASYASIVKKVAPSVVNVYSSRTVRGGRRAELPQDLLNLLPDDGSANQRRSARSRKEEGVGSGVIFSSDGYILTANHVVAGADEVKVDLPNGEKEVVAKVVGADPATDIAVLKVAATGLPPVTIANSDTLEVGDVLLAIGNPFHIGQTVTMGIVSGKGRNDLNITDYDDFIQTDAAINPGNSGGALVDVEGRLVGINTAIFSESGGNQGIGFAVPSNLARFVMESILTNGKVSRGLLGVGLQPEISADLAKEFKLFSQRGAMVAEVVAHSPAAEAGFKEGDVITEYDGKKITDRSQLRMMISQTAPGTKASFKVVRDGKEKALTATLAELKPDVLTQEIRGNRRNRNRQEERPQVKDDDRDALPGIEVSDIDAATRSEMRIVKTVEGALITSVEEDSESFTAGLRAGDVILEIARQPVRSAQDAIDASHKVSGERVLLRVWHGGSTRFVTVKNGAKKK